MSTLEISGNRIQQTIAEYDGRAVGRKFAARLSLKRFNTGCGWIADYPDPKERAAMWAYWRRYLYERLLPDLESCGFLAVLYRLVTVIGNARAVYYLMHIATRFSDPLSLIDRLQARFLSKRRLGIFRA